MQKRSLTDWAAIAEIVASVAVVISLIFVGLQVQKHTVELRATHSNDLYDAMREIELTMISTPHLTDAYEKAWNGRRDEMTDREQLIYQNYLVQSFTVWEQAFARAADGSMAEEDYASWEETFSAYLGTGVTREDVAFIRTWVGADFRKRLDEIAAEAFD